MPYQVQTAAYEGPFDLLLHLILREQVEIYEIDLSTIVDAYLAELERMEQLDLDVATEFLLIAATLVELKTRRLLPDTDDGDLEDELALWEERDLLLARLLECKTFKDASQALAHLASTASLCFPRTAGPDERYLGLLPDLLAGVTPRKLHEAFGRAVAPKPIPVVDLGHLHIAKLTVAEAVEELCDELPRVGRITFRELTASLVERVEVIVRFLAMLELYKQGLLEIDQATTFGEITLLWTGRGDGEFDLVADLAAIDVYEG